jgi:signal transduction histidine kinase
MRLRACLMARIESEALALVARDGERIVLAGGHVLAHDSLVARTLASGRPEFVPHTGADGPPRRCLAVPLLAGGETVGILAIERHGEIDKAERAAVERLGAHVGLALENSRLASRQRRFTEELAAKVGEATRHLEETDRMKSIFLAVASHELRTPLTALQGFTELMSTRDLPAPEMRRLAGIVHGETERLTRIVSDFLDLSHVERGLAPALCRGRVVVSDALHDAVRLLRQQGRGHRILVECCDALPEVDADPDALDRIIKNLVSNAVKYSPTGSAVRVRARAVAAGVEFSVSDEGTGIPAAALPRVFEPYYRGPGAAQAARGSGIGLAVVKSLVDAHGGVIGMESAPTRGTCVTFVLPSVP